MKLLNDKVSGSSLTASEWNEVPSELQNVMTALGQTLTSADSNQLGKSIAGYAVNSDFGTDSGAANAYVISKIGGKQVPTAYTDGFAISFRVGAANTGASTVNVFGLGVKSIFFRGAALVGGELTATHVVNLRFDSANDRFELVPNLTHFIDNDTGWTIGPIGSLGADTLNVNSGVGIGCSTLRDPLHIEANEPHIRLSDNNAATDTQVLALLRYFRGNNTSEVGRVGFNSTLDTHLSIENKISGNILFLTTDTLRGYWDNNGGFVVGSPSAGSLGAGTISIENQIGVGVSTDRDIAVHIEVASPHIRLSDSDAASDTAVLSMIQWYRGNETTECAYIGFDSSSNANYIIKQRLNGEIQFFTNDTFIGKWDNGGAFNIGTVTPQGAGTINAQNGVYYNDVLTTFAPITNWQAFHGGHVKTIASTTTIDLSALTEAVWHEFGGTGATNVLADLNDMPSHARIAIIRCRIALTSSTTLGQDTVIKVQARPDGGTTGSIKASAQSYCVVSGQGSRVENTTTFFVALDSTNQRFELLWDRTGAAAAAALSIDIQSDGWL